MQHEFVPLLWELIKLFFSAIELLPHSMHSTVWSVLRTNQKQTIRELLSAKLVYYLVQNRKVQSTIQIENCRKNILSMLLSLSFINDQAMGHELGFSHVAANHISIL